jgi:hypothetical protein
MKDLMLDLETWGKRYGCAVRSIGAVQFDRWGAGLGREFYVNVEDQSCLDAGLRHDPDTEAWWGRQDVAAQAVFAENPRPVREAAQGLCAYFRETGVARIWCQGANFDEPIIVGVLDALGMEAPWKFWNSRCTRTIYDAASLNFNAERRAGTHHHALHDAIHQARCVQKSFRLLGQSRDQQKENTR